MSSIYTITKWFKYLYNTLFTFLYSIIEVFISPNSIIRYSNILNFVLNTIFHLYPSFIRIRLKTFLRFNLVKILADYNLYYMS